MDEFMTGSTQSEDNSPGWGDADRVESGSSPGEESSGARFKRLVAGAISLGDATPLDGLDLPTGAPITNLVNFIKTLVVNDRLPSEDLLNERIEERPADDWPSIGAVKSRDMVLRAWEDVRSYLEDIRSNDVDREIVQREVREMIAANRIDEAVKAAANEPNIERRIEILRGIESVSDGDGFEPIDAVDLVREDLKPLVWILSGYLTQDTLALLTGYPGDGKTTFVYRLLLAIARGEPFLSLTTTKTKVLILGVEESRRAIISRLRRFGLMQRDRGRIFVHPKTLKADPKTYRDVIAFMKANEIGMLVIDTISQFWTVENENDNAEVALAMRELLALAHDDERCVLALHHEGKADGPRKSRGASSLPGIVDLHLALSRVKGADKADQRRVLTVEKKREELTPWATLSIAYNGEAWRYVEPEAEPSAADQVVETLRESGKPMSSSEIGVSIRLRGTATDEAIREAMESGRIESNGKSARARRYTLKESPAGVETGDTGDSENPQ